MTDGLLTLSEQDLRQLAEALRNGRLSAPYNSVALQRVLPARAAATAASALQALSEQGLGDQQLAVTLELVARDRSMRHLAEDVIDLVTTGPDAAGVAIRDTSVVVRELFAHAQQSVLVVGYAVYQGRQVFRALADRMRDLPQLQVQLFLDVRRPAGDSSADSEIVRRFWQRFRSHDWPQDRPLPELFYDPRALDVMPERRASLHAKCVIVDEAAVFVSSANFTEAAQQRNVEVGLLMRSLSLADRLAGYFRALVAGGQLVRVY
jgi:phosphatidylserine/phosphatidylglycerophosphate/cardiolipin synthase-like enzyme